MDCTNGSALAQLSRQIDTHRIIRGEQSSSSSNRPNQANQQVFTQQQAPEPQQLLSIIHPQHLHIGQNWAIDFPQARMNAPMDYQTLARFDAVYNQAHSVEQPTHQPSWHAEFNNPLPLIERNHSLGVGVFHRSPLYQPLTQQQPRLIPDSSWSKEFEKVKQHQQTIINSVSSKTALSESAGALLNTVENTTNPKFKDSKFLNLMKQFRDGEAGIEGDKVVEQIAPVNELSEESPAALNQGFPNGQSWANEFRAGSNDLQDWRNQFDGINFENNFEEKVEHDWAAEFKRKMELNGPSLDEADQQWESLEKQWNQDHAAYSAGSDSRFSNYNFTKDNPYSSFPLEFLADTSKHKNLTESVLALEAAVQKDPSLSKVWEELGRKQQENENDFAAISALRKSIELDPNNLDALMCLSVSYTNENYSSEAYDTLQKWIECHPRYNHLAPKNFQEVLPISEKHEAISYAFTSAAISNPGENLDEAVQTALGILFNISTEYRKAVDCFKSALSKQPRDYQLWNKLGATLANSNEASKAMDAYFHALELKPDYIRARYNLAIACIQHGQYHEAAEHLLGALSIQQNDMNQIIETTNLNNLTVSPDTLNLHGQSMNVWSTLRLLLDTYIRREDLVSACDVKDLDAFRKDFDF